MGSLSRDSGAGPGDTTDLLVGDMADQLAGDAACHGPFASPAVLASVNSDMDDWSPFLTADGLSLYFSSWRPGGAGAGDIWVARRVDPGAPFTDPVLVGELSSPQADGSPCLTADGLDLFFTSERPGGQGSADLWESRRADPAAPFSPPVNVQELNSEDWDAGCALTSDGLAIYFSSKRPGGRGQHDLWMATRPDRTTPFSTPVNLAGINSSSVERFVSLSADGLELYFSSDRPGGQGQLDVWRATRPDTASSFAAPENLGEVSSPGDDCGAFLSTDGRTLYLNYNADVAGTNPRQADIWVARRTCSP